MYKIRPEQIGKTQFAGGKKKKSMCIPFHCFSVPPPTLYLWNPDQFLNDRSSLKDSQRPGLHGMQPHQLEVMWGHWSPWAHGLPPGLGGDWGPLRAPLCHPASWPCSLSVSASSVTGTWTRRHTGPSLTSNRVSAVCHPHRSKYLVRYHQVTQRRRSDGSARSENAEHRGTCPPWASTGAGCPQTQAAPTAPHPPGVP